MRERGKQLRDGLVLRDIGQGFAGADPDASLVLRVYSFQFRRRSERDQMARRELTALHLGVHIGPARHRHRLAPEIRHHLRGLG